MKKGRAGTGNIRPERADLSSPILTVDVAHPPQSANNVEEELNNAVRQTRASTSVRILKIIHGYGSSGKGGVTREVVRNWAFRNRHMFRMIVEGEQFNLYDGSTQELWKEIGVSGR